QEVTGCLWPEVLAIRGLLFLRRLRWLAFDERGALCDPAAERLLVLQHRVGDGDVTLAGRRARFVLQRFRAFHLEQRFSLRSAELQRQTDIGKRAEHAAIGIDAD